MQWSRNEHVANLKPELKLGYKASAEQFAPRELVELAVAAEKHGMDSATVSDHFQPWRHEGGHAPWSLAWMAAVGERTKRIVLGTSVLTPTFRYNPAVIAQAFATMGCLYPDRVFLGVGTGEALNEIATGYEGEWPDFKERFARLRESIKLMRELWAGDRVDFDGEYYHTKGASIYDVPEGGVPVYVAAGGPVVAKYAGRAGDGFICTSGKGEELYKDKLIPAVAEGAAAANRNVDDIDKMIEIKISYDPDPDLALENTRFWAPLSLTAEQKHSIDDPIEMEKAANALPIEQVAKRWIVASDPDEAAEKVGQYELRHRAGEHVMWCSVGEFGIAFGLRDRRCDGSGGHPAPVFLVLRVHHAAQHACVDAVERVEVVGFRALAHPVDGAVGAHRLCVDGYVHGGDDVSHACTDPCARRNSSLGGGGLLDRLADRPAPERSVARQQHVGVQHRQGGQASHAAVLVVVEQRGQQLGAAAWRHRVAGDQGVATDQDAVDHVGTVPAGVAGGGNRHRRTRQPGRDALR